MRIDAPEVPGIRGSVLSLSVSQPQRIRMGDMEWSTSILKEPSAGPVAFTAAGPQGNRSAVHPEAVYAISSEAYDHWYEKLDIPVGSWRWGHWGENITFEGLLERDLRIGDVLELSGGVALQVSAPRHPCMKLAWRLGQHAGVLSELIDSGVLGFYLRVLQAGSISASEAVRVRRPHPANRTIIELPRLMHDKKATSAEIQSAINMPALSEYPKIFLRQRLSQALDNEQSSMHRWTGWRNFRIEKIVDEAQGIKSFYLAAVEGCLPVYRPGQFVSVEVPLEARAINRTWSLSDFSREPKAYRISIKAKVGGCGSRWMHEQATLGRILRLRAPAGRFMLDSGTPKPIVFISAGIGITPLLAMLKAHAQRRSGKTPHVIWIHGTKDSDTHAFRKEVDEVLTSLASAEQHVFYSRPGPDDRHGVDFQLHGRVTSEAVRQLIESVTVQFSGKGASVPGQICEFYICGPEAMQRDLRTSLIQWGVEDCSIHTEDFGAPDQKTLATVLQAARIRFTRSAVDVRWEADSEHTILELAEASGLALPNNCRTGLCHACACRVSSGAVTHKVEVDDLAPDIALLCCCIPATADVVLEA